MHNSQTSALVIQPKPPGDSIRPKGLWYARWDVWFRFATMPRTQAEVFQYWYQVELDFTKILILETNEQYDDFTSRFVASDRPAWKSVSEGWSGIEIMTPELVYRSQWSYSWNVPSGCIWTPSVVKSIERTGAP
jgi:hypothetical protein